ncbi:MAG TPA: hypothetical protein VFP81_00875 [Propionibacteriaceae bacterium]|nr:hypothetical protein [Propionibacteriaceae bacterium]
MSGDNRGDAATAHEAVADARQEAAAALARLAVAAVRYADARIAEETAAAATSGLPRIKRATPGEFVADELAVMLRDQPYQVRCLLARFPTARRRPERRLDHARRRNLPMPRRPSADWASGLTSILLLPHCC